MTNRRTLVVLGAGGDLSTRLLLPGLGQLLAAGRGTDLELFGVNMLELTEADWKRMLGSALEAGEADRAQIDALVQSSRYFRADATSAGDLGNVLAECSGTPILYFALPPAITLASCQALSLITLPPLTTLALEKPFGTNLEGARELNEQVAKLVPESRAHRVDHFLGKSTVLNLLGLRFANRVFEQLWNADNIERVEIRYDEQLGLEARAGYYDRAGALVDMIQSHLLLVLALVAMEPPSTLEPEDLRGAMAQALRATGPWQGDPVAAGRRGRYTSGSIGGRLLPSYADEPGVDPERKTETLAQVTVGVENWRWAGVPFVLRSGKALEGTRKDIVVTFKPVPHLPTGLTGPRSPTRLRIALDPDGIHLDLNINGEGDPFDLDSVTLSTKFAKGELGAYGEVLAGILDLDPTLSVRGDMAEECWRIVEPVLRAWRDDEVPLDDYPAGSDGPPSWRPAPGAVR